MRGQRDSRYARAARVVEVHGLRPVTNLGAGTYGVVVGCTDESYRPQGTDPKKWYDGATAGRKLAVKTMQDRSGFDHELVFARKFRHVNVMEVLDWFSSHVLDLSFSGWTGCILFECMDMDLQRFCWHTCSTGKGQDRRYLGPPPSVFGAVAAQLFEALAHIHDAGVMHRDIKPGNLMIRIFADEQQAAEATGRFGDDWVVHRINRGVSDPSRRLSTHVWLRIGDFGLATFRPDEESWTGTGDVITSPYRPPLLMVQQGLRSYEFPARGRRWRLAEAPGGPLRCVEVEHIHRRALRAALVHEGADGWCDLSKMCRTWWTTDRVPLGDDRYAEAIDSVSDEPTGVEMSNCAYGHKVDVFSAGAALAFAIKGYDLFLPTNHSLAWGDKEMSDYSILLTQQCVLGDVRTAVGSDHPVVRRMTDEWWYDLSRVPSLSDEDRRRLLAHAGTSVRTSNRVVETTTRVVGTTTLVETKRRTVAECVPHDHSPRPVPKAELVAKFRSMGLQGLADETERTPIDEAAFERSKLHVLESTLCPHPEKRWTARRAVDEIRRWCVEDAEEVAKEAYAEVMEGLLIAITQSMLTIVATEAMQARTVPVTTVQLALVDPIGLFCANCTIIREGLDRYINEWRLRTFCPFRSTPGCRNKRMLVLKTEADVQNKRRELTCDLQ